MTSLAERFRSAIRGLREGTSAFGAAVDPDEDLYRRVTSRRDLNPIAQDKAREVSFYLWRQNPMAHRLVEMTVDFVVGEGLTLGAVDDGVLEVITEFWNDPVMRLDLRHKDFVRDLALAGEVAFRAFTAEGSGRVRLGYIIPERIARVQLDPENALIDRTLWLKGPGGLNDEVPIPIVNLDETNPADPQLIGEAFYYGINRPTTATRGTPDLLTLADWLDGYDQMLWNVVDRSGFQNAFVWDVILEGQDQAAVDEWVRLHGTAPKPGTVRAHNEKEIWSSVSPDLGAQQIEVASRLVKNLILGGAGLPEGWFADGDSANRATLDAQGDPTYRMLQTRQKLVKAMFEDILGFVVDRAVQAGRLKGSVDRTVYVNIPDASQADVASVATALVGLSNSLGTAVPGKLISEKSARAAYLTVASRLGLEFDPDDEEDQIEEEAALAAEQAGVDAQAGAPEYAAMAAMGMPGDSPVDGTTPPMLAAQAASPGFGA